MDIDFELKVTHLWAHERPYKVTLTRGARGVYRWEIEVRGKETDDLWTDIMALDNVLQDRYAAIEPTEEEE